MYRDVYAYLGAYVMGMLVAMRERGVWIPE